MTLRTMAVLGFILISISSCADGMWKDSDYVGKGPVTLNAHQQAAFEKWIGAVDGEPVFFFLTGSTQYRVWCPAASGALCANASIHEAWKNCQSVAPNPCFLYAQNGQIVWDFGSQP